MICNNFGIFLNSIWLQAPWTSHRNFAVSKSLTQSLTVAGVADPGVHRGTRRADLPERVAGRLALSLFN